MTPSGAPVDFPGPVDRLKIETAATDIEEARKAVKTQHVAQRRRALAPASARLMDAFSRSALTLQHLQSGSGRTLQVRLMQVNATVGDALGRVQNPSACPIQCLGVRGPNPANLAAPWAPRVTQIPPVKVTQIPPP